MESQGSALGSNIDSNEDLIGSAASVEEIIDALARDGCSDLTSSIDLTACSNFPCAGGGFCNVYQGSLYDGGRIAIKSLRAYDGPEVEGDKDWRKNLKRIAKELRQWSRLQHCNVLPLMGLAVFRGHISMVSRWIENGDLMSYLRRNLDADRIRLCIDICAGLCYIHTSDLIHGDLKATNVLVSPDGTALIADFGNAEMENFALKSTSMTKGCLSVRWAAPELFHDGPHVSKEADVYAYGMTVLEVLTGEVPYPELTDIQVISLVTLEQSVQPRPRTGIDDGLWKILNWCWVREPSERPRIMSVDYCLHALFPTNSTERDQAPAGGRPKSNSSEENLINNGLEEPGQLWARFVPQEVADSISDQEKKRQEAISELIRTERDFARDLEYLRNHWIEPLLTEYIIPPERRAEFVQQVFWNIEDISDANTRLCELLAKRQNAHPIVESIGDIILEHVPHFLLFVQYGEHLLYAKYEFEKERSTNPAFGVFLETVKRLESHKIEINEYLLLPTSRLARYPLLLEVVLKYTPEDHVDRVAIPNVVRTIGELLERVNRAGDKLKLLQLDKGLTSRQGEGVDSKPEDEKRLVVYKGPLELRGRTAHENSNFEAFLFDDVLVMIQSKMVDEHEQREVFRGPAPLELLFVSTYEKKAPRPRAPRIEDNSTTLTANQLIPNGLVTNGSTVNGAFPLGTPARPNSQKKGSRLTVSRLGRKGYSLVLWAPTRAARQQWVKHITEQQNVIHEQNMAFRSVMRDEDILVGQAKANCAVPYDHGRRVAYGTDAGVYFQSLHEDQNQALVKVLDLVDVQQIDVLRELQLLVVLSGRSVLTFPLDVLDTADLVKRMKRISSYASFFKTGHCLGRTLICVVKSGPSFSTVKVLEPIDQNAHENLATDEQQPQGGNNTLKVFREFPMPTESRSAHFLGTKLCMEGTGGFKIIDLETLDTHALLNPADASLNFVKQREDMRPLNIYRIDEDYLLCYADFAFYVNESGSRSRKGVTIYWEGAPTAFALCHPYVLAFDPTFIEIRHVVNGSLVQVIRGNNLRLLFADTPSITNSWTSPPSPTMGGSAALHSDGGHDSQYRDYPYGQNQRNQHDAAVSDPALTQQEQRPPPELNDIIVLSDDKVMAVRLVARGSS